MRGCMCVCVCVCCAVTHTLIVLKLQLDGFNVFNFSLHQSVSLFFFVFCLNCADEMKWRRSFSFSTSIYPSFTESWKSVWATTLTSWTVGSARQVRNASVEELRSRAGRCRKDRADSLRTQLKSVMANRKQADVKKEGEVAAAGAPLEEGGKTCMCSRWGCQMFSDGADKLFSTVCLPTFRHPPH